MNNDPMFDLDIIARQYPDIRKYFQLIGQGRNIYFAIDFSEIYPYLLPLEDFFGEKREETGSDYEKFLARKVQRWYISKLLLDNPLENEPTILIPPYVMEFRHKLSDIQKQIAKYSLNEDLIEEQIIEPLKKSKKFRKAIGEFKKERNNNDLFSNALRDLYQSASKEISMPFSILIETLTGGLNKNLSRLDKAIQSKKLKHSREIFDVDASLIMSSCWNIIDDIEIAYKKRRRNITPYNAFVDAFACEYINQVNRGALINVKDPFIILISRSSIFPDIEKLQRNFQIKLENGDVLSVLWKPETYLAYRLVKEYSNNRGNINIGIRQLEELDRLINELKKEGKNINEHRDDIFRQLEETFVYLLNTVYFHTSLYNQEEFSEEKSFFNFSEGVDLVQHILGNKEKVSEKLSSEAHDLWRIITLTDDRLSALDGYLALSEGGEIPKVEITTIKEFAYFGLKIENYGFWIKLMDLPSKWQGLLIQTLEEEKKDKAALEIILKMVKDQKEYTLSINILMAALLIGLKNYDKAQSIINSVRTEAKIDFMAIKEIELLQGSLLYLKKDIDENEINECIRQLQLFLPTQNISDCEIETDPKDVKKRSVRIYKLLALLYTRLIESSITEKQYFREKAFENLWNAYERAEVIMSENKEDPYCLYINCINNLLYFHIENINTGFFKDEELINTTEKLVHELNESLKRYLHININTYPEIYHTMLLTYQYLNSKLINKEYKRLEKKYFEKLSKLGYLINNKLNM